MMLSGWVITFPLGFVLSSRLTFRLTCTGRPVLTDLSQLSFYNYPVLVVLSEQPCPSCHAGHPVLSILSSLTCPGLFKFLFAKFRESWK
jgi:hypothetical protein